MLLLDLPEVMIEHVFSFLTYDEVAKNRIICKDFDAVCQRILNRGFLMIERRHSLSLKAIKALLPRRESERRSHTFSRHCDILTSMETRLSMLSMTYTKFIDHNICCFIPGKVIDEVRRVLSIVEKSETLPRAHEVLQELRDISSMAIEHFDDQVSPALRAKMQASCKGAIPNNGFATGSLTPTPAQVIQELKLRCIRNQRSALQVARRMRRIQNKLRWYKCQVNLQNRVIKQISKKQAEQESNMAELKRRIEECDVKYQELNSQGGKGIKDMASSAVLCAPAKLDSASVGLKHFGSQIRLDPSLLPIGAKRKGRASPNIKPRKSTLEPPTREISSQLLTSQLSLTRPKRRKILHDPAKNENLSHIQSSITQNVFKNISSVLSDLLGNDGKRKPVRKTENRIDAPSTSTSFNPPSKFGLRDEQKLVYATIQNKFDTIKKSLLENNIEDEIVHGDDTSNDSSEGNLVIVEDEFPMDEEPPSSDSEEKLLNDADKSNRIDLNDAIKMVEDVLDGNEKSRII